MVSKYYKHKQIDFGKAVKFLDGVLAGKGNKRSAYEADISEAQISKARRMFPLFTGYLGRKPVEGRTDD